MDTTHINGQQGDSHEKVGAAYYYSEIIRLMRSDETYLNAYQSDKFDLAEKRLQELKKECGADVFIKSYFTNNSAAPSGDSTTNLLSSTSTTL